jgi:hypothetical protein
VIRKSRVLRASPRHVAPTLATEIPVALIKASRRPSSPDLDEPMAVDADIEGFEDDDELPGPRGSSPELDVEALLAARTSDSGGDARPPAISPVTPNLPFPADRPPSHAEARAIEIDVPPMPADVSSTERLIASALAATTAKMRAVAIERESERNLTSKALPAPGTPVDFVIPIDVTETLNEAAPRQRAHFALAALTAALLLIAMGTFVAVRTGALRSETRSSSAVSLPPPPVAAGDLGPSSEASAIVTTPAARAAATSSAMPLASASANAAPAGRASTGPSAPASPPATPAAKPKKSIYDPAP